MAGKKSSTLPRIAAQKIPRARKASLGKGYARPLTKEGKNYGYEAKALRGKVQAIAKERVKTANVMAFARNYFIKHGRMPSFRMLEKVFPYLRK